MHDYAWTLILRGTVDHKSPARHPTFGTIGLQGMPELRTVVLRQADQKSASLEVHTDLKSAKVKELKSNPNVGIHIWFPKLKLQIRIKAISEIETGKQLKKNGIKFQKDPEFLMEQSQSPGTPISAPFIYEKPANFDRFCVIFLKIDEMDLVHLGVRHTRALFAKKDNWSGTWLAP